jgi:glycosyltransferase involved in cell wall biosynthesis
MVRVLHLRSVQPDFQTERLAAALARRAGGEFSVTTRTLGRGGDFRNPFFAFAALRGKWAAEFDVVHPWDTSAFWAAVAAGSRRVVFSPSVIPAARPLGLLKKVMGRRAVTLICASESEQRRCVAAGVPPGHCQVIRPGVDFSELKPVRDEALRASMGLAHDDSVLLSPGESTRAAGHRDALWTASILHVLEPHFRALFWGHGHETPLLQRLAEKLRQPRVLMQLPELKFEELLPLADAVLFVPRGPTSVLPLAQCLAAGLPVIAPQSPGIDDILKDRQNAIIVPRRSPRVLAQAVLELRQDAELRSSIAAGARETARGMFSLERFVGDYRKAYCA